MSLRELAWSECDPRRPALSGSGQAFAQAHARLRAALAAACGAQPGWAEGVAAAIAAALALGASEPALMRALTVDVFDEGLAGALRYRHMVEGLAMTLLDGRSRLPRAQALPAVTEEALIGAVASPIAAAVRMGREAELPPLAGELSEFVLTPYLGAGEARRVAGRRAGAGGEARPAPG